MRRIISISFGSLVALGAMTFGQEARAGIEACGNIHIEASAECEIDAGIQCEARCEPLTIEAACAGQLYVECEGECNAELDVACTADCQGSCEAECEIDPAEFSCEASCQADCEGNCEASCMDSECQASCQATCSGECSASCEVVPGSAECTAQCDACCSGSCTAEANFDCQVSCQGEAWAQCEVDIEGGCKAACERDEGALFCDGQYVDHGGNLKECADALKARFNLKISGSAEGECSNGMCSGEAGGTISCDVDPYPATPWTLLLLSPLLVRLRRAGTSPRS